MNKRLRERLDGIDTKSILLTVAILGLLIFLVFKYSNPVDSPSIAFDTPGIGTITSIVPVTEMRQSRKGTRISTTSYRVTYQYSVGGVTYEQVDEIKNIGRNQLIIDKLINGDSVIDIVYNATRPKDSKIRL